MPFAALDIPVQHHYLGLLKWKDENGTIKELKIYSRVAHKWNQVATLLGFDHGQIESIKNNPPFNDLDRVQTVFRQWFENATKLPNASKYPKSWQGLINLLEDVELSEVAKELCRALANVKFIRTIV